MSSPIAAAMSMASPAATQNPSPARFVRIAVA
jgi:hypothetical protein